MTEGDKVICQHDDWFNAFGDLSHPLACGQRLTVSGTKRIGGARFLQFVGEPEANWYLDIGFVPLRNLN